MQMQNLYTNYMQSFWCPRQVELGCTKKIKTLKILWIFPKVLLTLTVLRIFSSQSLYSQFFTFSKFSLLSIDCLHDLKKGGNISQWYSHYYYLKNLKQANSCRIWLFSSASVISCSPLLYSSGYLRKVFTRERAGHAISSARIHSPAGLGHVKASSALQHHTHNPQQNHPNGSGPKPVYCSKVISCHSLA